MMKLVLMLGRCWRKPITCSNSDAALIAGKKGSAKPRQVFSLGVYASEKNKYNE